MIYKIEPRDQQLLNFESFTLSPLMFKTNRIVKEKEWVLVCVYILSASVQYIYMRPDNNKKDEEKNKTKQNSWI